MQAIRLNRIHPPTRRSDRTARSIIALTVIAVAAGLGSANPASASRIYAGQPVSQRLQLVLDISDDGTRLQTMSFFLDLPCRRTDRTLDMGTATAVAELPAQPSAGSHASADTTIAAGRLSATLLTVRARGTRRVDVTRGQIAGSISASEGHGTLVARRTVVERATGRALRSCTRTMRWRTLRGPGTIFAGTTSSGAPVVLRLTPDHRRVTQSLISWAAPCRRLSFYIEPHDKWLLPFALAPGGRFAKSYRYDAGGGGEVIGRFAGRVGETTAAGTFRSRLQSRRDRCELPPQTWTATTG
jgi:hypothetical protein